MYRISPFIRYFAAALLSGAALATLWVNLAPESYYDVVEFRLLKLPLPDWLLRAPPSVTLMSLVSTLLMPLFFFFLGKELWEALILERGALTLSRQPILPIGALVGSTVGAIVVWLVAVILVDPLGDADLRAGWATGIGSDVVLCYVIGRIVFGRAHPALHFLLLLTVAQDVVALCAAALTAPLDGLRLAWALLAPAAAIGVWLLFGRHARSDASEVRHQRAAALWPYAVAGVLSWMGLSLAGFPPELGLLPIIPAIPHAARSFGIFAEAEGLLHDPLNRMILLLIWPITAILFLFGLARGAIELSAFGAGTQVVLATFWLGKPLGLLAGTSLALTFGGGKLPEGLRLSDLVLIAMITAFGFSAPVTVLDLTLEGGISTAEVRLGLAISVFGAVLAMLVAQTTRRGRSRYDDKGRSKP